MGVDCKIKLPDNVRVRNVASVIGIAAGLQPEWDGSHGAKWVKVPGVEVNITSIPEMVEIVINGDLIDGEKNHFVYYHFETEHGRLLGPRSTAFWIAIAHRLVDFFGGEIDYQDCDNEECDYKRPANSQLVNSPEDNEEWDSFQKRLFNVTPIDKEELDYFDKKAAYKMKEMK